MYKIEKHIPTPPEYPKFSFPFKELEVGDSFMVPFEDVSVERSRYLPAMRALPKVATPAWHAGNRLGRVFKCKIVDGGVRCWRVS